MKKAARRGSVRGFTRTKDKSRSKAAKEAKANGTPMTKSVIGPLIQPERSRCKDVLALINDILLLIPSKNDTPYLQSLTKLRDEFITNVEIGEGGKYATADERDAAYLAEASKIPLRNARSFDVLLDEIAPKTTSARKRHLHLFFAENQAPSPPEAGEAYSPGDLTPNQVCQILLEYHRGTNGMAGNDPRRRPFKENIKKYACECHVCLFHSMICVSSCNTYT